MASKISDEAYCGRLRFTLIPPSDFVSFQGYITPLKTLLGIKASPRQVASNFGSIFGCFFYDFNSMIFMRISFA